jgi:two-component system phosphate regulon sensor histidine kinase PhoR
MEEQRLTIISIILFSVSLFLTLYIQDPFLTGFVWIVVLVYHIIAFYSFRTTIEDMYKTKVERLQYDLDQMKRTSNEVESQLISLAKIIDSGVILIDEHDVIKQANSQFQTAFDINNVEGETYEILKPLRTLYKMINKAYLKEEKTRNQMIYNDIYFDVNITPIFEETYFRGCLVVVHDVTQLKNAETFQKQFTADVSHELKTPLSAIKGISEIIMNNQSMTKDEREDFIKTIYLESTRLETILNDLLIISKMDRLDYELSLEETSIHTIINDVIKLLTPMAKDKGLALTKEVEPATLDIDAIKMRQVIMNLIKNAIAYTDHGSVHVSGSIKDEKYEIKVRDTGIGIPEEEHEKVFKRFYRVDEARSRASGGSGLGLSIIKNVVKKHQGTLSLESKQSTGSTFTVNLPIHRELH